MSFDAPLFIQVVQADVQYLQIQVLHIDVCSQRDLSFVGFQNSGGGYVYVPLYSPNGQTLMQAVPQQTVVQQPTMQQTMQQDLGRVSP